MIGPNITNNHKAKKGYEKDYVVEAFKQNSVIPLMSAMSQHDIDPLAFSS